MQYTMFIFNYENQVMIKILMLKILITKDKMESYWEWFSKLLTQYFPSLLLAISLYLLIMIIEEFVREISVSSDL